MECSETDTCASAATLSLCVSAYSHIHTHFFHSLSFSSSATPLPFLYSPPLLFLSPPSSMFKGSHSLSYRAARLVCILTIQLPRSCSFVPCDRWSMCMFLSYSALVLTQKHTFPVKRKGFIIYYVTAIQTLYIFVTSSLHYLSNSLLAVCIVGGNWQFIFPPL